MAAGLEDLFGHQAPGEPDAAAGELRRALIVAAHPDDADFGAGGTAALLAEAGWTVRYLVLTDGSKGTEDPAITTDELIATRRREQEAAAGHLGVADCRFLPFVDGELAPSRAALGAVVREIREFRPFAVYTHDPEPVVIEAGFINHADHRATGLLAVDAVYPAARDHRNFPEHAAAGLAPHHVRELYLWGTNAPNFEVDVSAVGARKVEALLLHRSQFPDPEGFRAMMAAAWSEPDGRQVERFRRVVLFR